jgi:hypothetical protein
MRCKYGKLNVCGIMRCVRVANGPVQSTQAPEIAAKADDAPIIAL